MKALKHYLNESITCEDVFDINKTGEELLLNQVVGADSKTNLIISKAKNGRIVVSSQGDHGYRAICAGDLKELIEEYDIKEVVFNYPDPNISCLSGLKKLLKIKGDNLIRFEGGLENVTIECNRLLLYKSKKLKNCKIDCDNILWGDDVDKTGEGASDIIKLPFENCNIKALDGMTFYYTEKVLSEILKEGTLTDKNLGDFFGFGSKCKTPLIECQFETKGHELLRISKNFSRLSRYSEGHPRTSEDGWYYLATGEGFREFK